MTETPAGRSERWSGRWDSNPRRLAWEASTLPLSYTRSWRLRRLLIYYRRPGIAKPAGRTVKAIAFGLKDSGPEPAQASREGGAGKVELNFSHLVPSVLIFSHHGGGFKAELMPSVVFPERNFDSGAIVSRFVPLLTFRRRAKDMPGRPSRRDQGLGASRVPVAMVTRRRQSWQELNVTGLS